MIVILLKVDFVGTNCAGEGHIRFGALPLGQDLPHL